MIRNLCLLLCALPGLSFVVAPPVAHACGGFACAGGGATPVVQAAERVLFERQGDQVRAYIQIQYSQTTPIGFSWIIPVTSVPELGVADPLMFQELDAASAPRFQFINNPFPTSSGSSSCGSMASDASAFRGAGGIDDSESGGVRVWNESRVGDYQTAVISGDSTEEIRDWLVANDYDVPERLTELLAGYVYTGHIFAAFRYAPLDGQSGTLPPVTVSYRGLKPCVPVKLTAIASTPVLDIMVMAFGEGRTTPDPEGDYIEVLPEYSDIQIDNTSATFTTYTDEVDRVIAEVGGHGWVVEHAGTTDRLQNLTSPEAQALVARNAYVTRFYTRMSPEMMDVDPEFVIGSAAADVARLHVIDLGADSRASLGQDSGMRFAAPPMALAMITVFFRRRRRRR